MVELDDLRSLAAGVAAQADLQQVRLFHVEGTLDQFPSEAGAFGYTFDTNIEVQHVTETQSLIVDGTYSLVVYFSEHPEVGESAEGRADDENIASGDERQAESDEHQHLAHLNFQLAALYLLPDYANPGPFPDNELDAFGRTTGMLALHPYAREFVSNMTGRMGLPPLHLPTARIHLDKRNAEHES